MSASIGHASRPAFSELPAAETTTAAMLSAVTKCLDATEVVRVLVSAAHTCLDETDLFVDPN